MKYKVAKGTKIFSDLEDMFKEIDRVDLLAKEMAAKYGANFGYLTPSNCLARGLVAIELTKKPDGWRMFDKSSYGYYCPKRIKKNHPIIDEWNSLPVIHYSVFNDIVGYKIQKQEGFLSFNMGLKKSKDGNFFLLNCNEKCSYTPISQDIIEILTSEYNSLIGI